MLSMKCFQVAVLAFAAVGLGFAPAGDAYAGSCKSDRSYDRGHISRDYSRHSGHDRWRSSSHRGYSNHGYDSRTRVSYRNDNVRFSVNIGSHRSYDRGYHQPTYRSGSSCSKTVVYHTPPPSGYWKRVYHSPVYETRYDSCGRPYRVCVRAGYYERVWVQSSYCR